MISASTNFKNAADNPQRITTKKFVFNGTDYSTALDAVEPIDIRMFEGDDVTAGALTVTVINDDKAFNAIKTNKAANFNKIGAVSVGFDGEFITSYQGKLDGAEFPITDRHRAILRFTAKLKACVETTLGSDAYPIDYSSSAWNPADLTWELLTNRGGLDATASTENPDIDYQLWSDYKSICSDLGFSIRANFTGQSIAEALRRIGELTDAIIYPDPTGKVYHRKFIPRENPSPYLFTEENAHLENPRVYLNRDRIINNAKIWYGYDPAAGTWAGSVTKTNSTSITNYGQKGREFADTGVWHDNVTSAGSFGDHLVNRYTDPVETIEFQTRRGTQALLHQIGDIIQVTCAKQDLAAKNMQVYGASNDVMAQKTDLLAEDLGPLNGNFLILDSATQGDPDNNVLY